MGDKWHTAKVGEIAEKVAMGPFGSSIKVSTFIDEGIPIISGKHLHGIKLEDSEFNFISYDHAERLKNANVNRGDIVFTHAGNIGQVAYIPESSKYKKYILSQRQFYMRCDRRKVLPEFVTYFFKTPEGQHRLLANTSQTGVPSIAQPVSYLKTIEIPLPPLSEQKAIASILGALDDKIELNRKMNEILEAIARAIFKSWFVDFDPIPGFAPHKEWQDSPLGRIPKGWRVGTLGEMCEIIMGQSPPGETYNEMEEGLPFYQGIRDFGFRFPNRRVYCNAASRIAQKGDVLLSVRAPVGSLNIAGEKCAIGRGVAALRIKGQHYGFLYYLMKETQWEWEKYEAEGTVFGSANKTDVQNFSIIVPRTEAILRFNEVVFPMDETIKNNEMQSLTLASIRDSLLPKLLSGKIRVKDAERVVEHEI